VTSNGNLVVLSLTNGGVLVSRNHGCSFERALGPLEGNRGADLALDTSQPGHVLALMSTIVEVVDAGYPRFLSTDGAASFNQVADTKAGMSALPFRPTGIELSSAGRRMACSWPPQMPARLRRKSPT
jgi:hypothetical protein